MATAFPSSRRSRSRRGARLGDGAKSRFGSRRTPALVSGGPIPSELRDWAPEDGYAFSLAVLHERAKWLEAHLPTIPPALVCSRDLNLGYRLLVEQAAAAARDAQDLSARPRPGGSAERLDAWIARRRYEQLRAVCDLVQLNLIAMSLREIEHIDAPTAELLLAADSVVERSCGCAGADLTATQRNDQ
jgi:hypothetical protein